LVAISDDASRVLVSTPDRQTTSASVNLILNWPSMVRRR
jgi:hypothetical protein